MIDKILDASGIPSRSARYPQPPAETYGIYFDAETVDGPDAVLAGSGVPLNVQHDVSVELYEPIQDPDAEAAFEGALVAHGVTAWEKDDRYWLQNAQRYQVIYRFTFYEKRRA